MNLTPQAGAMNVDGLTTVLNVAPTVRTHAPQNQ